ncbi:MAG: response regulator, partial [Nitrospiria bacterium]
MLSKSIAERPIRVLIIEDSAFYRLALTEMLSSVQRIEIIGTAIDGADAIMQVTKQRPDVITLDLEMPRVDGFVFLRWLMKNVPTPVVVVSSQSDQASVFKALELGAVDFLAKPAPHSTPKIMEMRDQLIAKIITVSGIRIERLNPRILSYEEGLS